MSERPIQTEASPRSENAAYAASAHVIRTLRKLNLFSDNPFWSSTLTISEQILSTRLFLVLISASLLFVIGFASLSVRTHDITLNRFTIDDFERLKAQYPTTIYAPCTEVSIPYKKFLDFSPRFHQICSSPFVRRKWTSSLFIPNATAHNILDFRTFAFSHYRSLALLCYLARQAVNDTQRAFNATHLVDLHTFSRNQFNELASVLAGNLQQNILTNEKRTARVVSMITAQNRLLSALRTNFYIQSTPGSRQYIAFNGVYLEHNGTDESYCDCRLSENQCKYPAGAFYNWTVPELGKPAKNDPPPLFQIPGLMAGCMPLDATRQSTLECLFNQSCINAIALQPILSRPKALNPFLSRFPVNTTIGSMFDESLFIESWNNEFSFEKYYSACAPQSLSYKYESNFHLSSIIAISISAFGGLVIAMQLITPAIVKFWKLIKWNRRGKKQTNDTTDTELEMVKLAPKQINKAVTAHVHRTIHNFNLFPSENKNDLEKERIGIIATRCYIFFILIGLLILGFYTSILQRNQTRTVEEPSLSKFEELHKKYSSTLSCPCSRFSMQHARIMSLSPRYHTICSSEYISDYWLSYFGRIEIDLDSIGFLATDFRISGLTFFDLIRVLCETSHKTVESALRVFRVNRLVTLNALSRLQFQIETTTRLKQFQQQTIASFLDLIELIRSLIQTNQIAEETWTNVGPVSRYDNVTSRWSLNFRSRDFYANSCSCALLNNCTRPIGFYFQEDGIRTPPNITVPGLVLGCYAIDSLLLSTLECFYDKKCVELIVKNYDFDVVGLVRPLDSRAANIKPLRHENSRFHLNSTVNEIFSQLFIEDWLNTSNFTAYYNRCAPVKCTYTIQKRFDTTYMFTIMLGFYGGLSNILEIILPLIVGIVLKQWSQREQQTNTNNVADALIEVPENPARSSSVGVYHCCYSRLEKYVSLNLFSSDSSLTEKRFQNQEIIATRIYIFIFMLCIIAAVLYCGPFSEETKSIKENYPTMDTVNQLHRQNISSLSCPCSKAAVPFSKLLSVKPDYHSICTSEYVSQAYIRNLLNKNDSTSLLLSAHYRLLSSLCHLSRRLIENSLLVFNSRELVSIETLSRSSFNTEIEAIISTFISQTLADYRRTRSFIVNSFSVNQLLNLFTSNWQVDFSNEDEKYIIKTSPTQFSSSNCSCALSSDCSEPLIDEIVRGCFPYDGFRLSKFGSLALQKLDDELFVEKWTNKSNYTDYFHICRPLECQYTLSDKNNPLYMLTTLLGLYGGTSKENSYKNVSLLYLGLTYTLRLIINQSLLAYRWWTERSARKINTNESS